MSITLRRLNTDDQEQINLLCMNIWDGRDYLPGVFSQWVKSSYHTVLGLFNSDELVATCTLERIADTDIGWVEALRVKESYRGQGLGSRLVHEIVDIARRTGVKTLWYATGSNNNESQTVARKTGFRVTTAVGHFRIERPFPAHPSPSPSIVPLEVTPERLYDMIQQCPELVDVERMPLSWSFDFRDLAGLRRIGTRTRFRTVIEEDGTVVGLFYSRVVRDGEGDRITFHVFSTERSVFVDIMARLLDEAEQSDAERAVFFVGPRLIEWCKTLGYVNREDHDRTFLLFEQDLR